MALSDLVAYIKLKRYVNLLLKNKQRTLDSKELKCCDTRRMNGQRKSMTANKRPEKSDNRKQSELNVHIEADDQGLVAIYETLKSRPVGCDFLIRTGGAMRGNCILRMARHSYEVNGGYCGGNIRCACFIILSCLELHDHRNYV